MAKTSTANGMGLRLMFPPAIAQATGYESYVVGELLGDGDKNPKLLKSNKARKGYITFGLTLAAASASGYNVCKGASAGCIEGCLKHTGHGTMFNVTAARIAKTRAFFEHRAEFLAQLHAEISRAEKTADRKGMLLAIRLNMQSDLPWERIDPTLFSLHPNVTFYDYTKVPGRVTPANYSLTYSRSETNETDALAEYARGLNVAVVFDADDVSELPTEWNGIPVFDAVATDLRFLDPRGIAGLISKGHKAHKAKIAASGFAVSIVRGGRRVA